ncbi:MAG: acyl carrier protein [Acidobacteriota bacterium]
MEDKIKAVMAGILEIPADSITDATTMETVDTWDSLRHMEIIVGLEDAFGIELAAEDLMEMTSLAEIKRVLASKGVK